MYAENNTYVCSEAKRSIDGGRQQEEGKQNIHIIALRDYVNIQVSGKQLLLLVDLLIGKRPNNNEN